MFKPRSLDELQDECLSKRETRGKLAHGIMLFLSSVNESKEKKSVCSSVVQIMHDILKATQIERERERNKEKQKKNDATNR